MGTANAWTLILGLASGLALAFSAADNNTNNNANNKMSLKPANDEYSRAPQIFFLMETDSRHRGDRFRILHECVPDETGAVVLRHQHHDTQINSDHVRVIPA